MKILHLGLCAGKDKPDVSGIVKSLIKYSSEYRELHTGDPNFNEESVLIANEFKPDIIFMQIQNASIITEECAKQLKETGAWVVNWTGDVRHPIPLWYMNIGQHIDMTLFSNMTDVKTFRELGYASDYLDIGVDPEVFYPDPKVEKDLDIVFMANNYKGKFPLSDFRYEVAMKMKEHFGDQFKLYGNGWTNHDGSYNHSQAEENSIYQRTKIAINCSHFDYERYSSDRMLRILASGAMCMTKWYPLIEVDYTENQDVVIWNSVTDLITKCEYYLFNDLEREWVSHKGLERVLKTRTFDKQVENLLQIWRND
jgi:spore maturation protein CgeB